MAEERARVATLLTAWGYDPGALGEIRKILDVFMVETIGGVKNLKWTRLSDGKLLFILSALQHLEDNGFRLMRRPLPTIEGAPFLVEDGQHYLLSDWIEGCQVDLTRPEQLASSCRTLALFHRASRGYKPPSGTSPRPCWGQLVTSFSKRCRELQGFPAGAAARDGWTPFDRLIREETAYYLALAIAARDLLTASDYRELAARAASEGSLCHGDVAARNFILTPAGDVCLIDFDSLRQDLSLTDLWKLFRRIMKSRAWDFDLACRILAAYESVIALSPHDLEVLLALVSFPQKFWRLANRYYSGRYPVEGDRFYNKMRKFIAQRKAHADFLVKLFAFCRERGAVSRAVCWPSLPGLLEAKVLPSSSTMSCSPSN